ncbi:MAG: efflux RND transporter permease subunit [Deltaproteobacteria bacterium]|nr:efflux RND transporter permease subunit [Deltaproteobacteria bacterium]MBW2076261.1 efflux RND transporter permease subunit [Deltaproteobacteria bacterium]
MNIPEFSVNRKITVLMLTLIVCLFGVISFFRVGIDMMPDLEYPFVSVVTTYEGVASEDIENLITRPIEEAVSTTKRVKTVRSISKEGVSVVMVEFEWGTLLDFAAQDVRDKLSWITDFLPEDSDSPMVVKFNMSDSPILFYGVTGMADTIRLRKYLNDNVKPRIERLDGVASCWVAGGLEREINVFVDRDRLRAYHLSLDQVIGTLRTENLNVSAGHVTRGYTEYLVRTMGEYKSLEPIANTIVGMHNGTPIYIKDIAAVKDTHKEVRSYSRTNRKDSLVMMILKQSGANTVTVIDRVKRALKEMRAEIPEGVEFHAVMDFSRIIKKVVKRTTFNAVEGAILAVMVILLFLGNWRPTLIIFLAIPLSVITTFMGIYGMGYTFNIMTLGGLALGIGMLVDNAVVVIENTFRHLDELKEDRREAAKSGATEVGMAITASTLTTVAVFLPMVLTSGMAGKLSRPLAVTVCLALFASLFVSLTIVPMIASTILGGRRDEAGKGPARLRFEPIRGAYRRMLRWALGHRVVVLAATVALFAGSIYMVPQMGLEFMPKQDIPVLSMMAKMPVGTNLDETNRVIAQVEDTIIKQPETEHMALVIGLSEASKMDLAWGMGTTDVNEAQIFARLMDKEKRTRLSDEITEAVRSGLPRVKEAEFVFVDLGEMMMGGGSESPVEVKVFGKDLPVLKEVCESIAQRCRGIPGLKDVELSLKATKPEIRIEVDREKAARLGLTVGTVGRAVKEALLGIVAGKYRIGGDEYDIRVRFQGFDRNSVTDIKNINIPSPLGPQIPLYQIASIGYGKGPVEITRENQERKVTVKGNTFGRDMGSIVRDIQDKVARIRIPDGYFVKFGGRYQDMQEAFSSLAWALVIAILLVYMIMAAQFESLLTPFVIMFTVPLAFIGVVFGLLAFGKTLSVPSVMGISILTGIVVNNAIVMIDYINRLRKRGIAFAEAIVEGAAVRLRPILITAITTILGMLPMALSQSEGAELRSPMAVAVASGLLFSTFLTLFIIPIVYSIVNRVSCKHFSIPSPLP